MIGIGAAGGDLRLSGFHGIGAAHDGGLEERSGLAVDDLAVIVFGQVEFRGPLELKHFAFGQVAQAFGKDVEYPLVGMVDDQVHGAGKPEIPDQHGRGRRIECHHGGNAPADGSVVGHVVVHQRGRVQQLGGGGTTKNALIARPAKGLCNEQRKGRTQFLATVVKQEAVGLPEQRNLRLEAGGEQVLEIRPGPAQKLLDGPEQG